MSSESIVLEIATYEAMTQELETLRQKVTELEQITAQAQAEALRSRTTAELYGQMLDAIPTMVLCKAENSRIVYGNKAFQEFYGMTQEQLQGLIDSPVNNPDYTQQYIRDDHYVFTTGKTLEILEEPVIRHDGEVRWFHTVKSAILNEAGEVVYTVGVSSDITGQRQTQAIFRKQAQLLDQVKGSVISTDLNGIITSWNQDSETLFGYSAAEALGQHISFIYPEGQMQVLLEHVLEPLQQKGQHEAEVKLQRRFARTRAGTVAAEGTA